MPETKLHILIVEDNEPDFRLVVEYLKESHTPAFEITRAKDLRGAFKAIAEKKFDAILTDLDLPDSRGLSTLENISKVAPHLPIVVITGQDDQDTGVAALQRKAQDYLVKGCIHGDILSRSIRHAIERKRAEEAFQKLNLELEKRVEGRTSDLVKLNRQLGEEILEREEREKFTQARNFILDLIAKKSQRKDFLDELLKHLVIWSGCRNVGIRVLNEDGRIPYEVHTGFDNEFLRQENNLSVICDQCCCIRVINGKLQPHDKPCMTKFGSFFSNNSSEFLTSLSEKEQGTFRGACFKKGYASLAIIPINYRGKTIAAIHFTDQEKGRFTPKRVAFLEQITPLIGEGIIKFNLEERIRQSYVNQGLVNSLLRLAFKDISLEEILQKALEMILAVSWFQFEGKGIVFLTEEGSDELLLKAHKGLHPHLLKECHRVPFGKCVCGKAALKREVQFIGSNSHEHEIQYQGMKPHSHYCVPIISNQNRVLGVINIFLRPSYPMDRTKEEFLSSIANALTAIIEQKRTQGELSMTQKELNEARRLSDIGTLAATVAHELRNPLAAIRMAAFNIKRKAQNELLEKHFFNIEKKVMESDQIINNLLFYSRLKVPRHESINMYDIVDECITAAKNRASKVKAGIKKKYRVLRRTPIQADPLQMKELFTNILNNSFDALVDHKGVIEVRAEIDGHKHFKVSIKDNGIGIDSEHLDKIHEPFFTTKAKGTGLGLTVCYQIVSLHNGTMDIQSKKQEGTTVTVTLPLHPETAPNNHPLTVSHLTGGKEAGAGDAVIDG